MTISKVLIANRGEIACRILRACREAGLATVAIYAQNDTGTIFTELADEAFLLEGDSIASTYLDQSQILEIARISADAIHPGFGFYQNGQISHRQLSMQEFNGLDPALRQSAKWETR